MRICRVVRLWVVVAILGVAARSDGSVSFSIAHRYPAEGEVRYIAPHGGIPYGTMAYAPWSATLSVDLSEGGGGVHEFQAIVDWNDWRVSSVTSDGVVLSASVSGAFAFVELESGNAIVSGSFQHGVLLEAAGAGAFTVSDEGGLVLEVGSPLQQAAPGLQGFVAGDMGIALSRMSEWGVSSVETEEGILEFFVDFYADAALFGTAQAMWSCLGDLDGDGMVTVSDFAIFVGSFGESVDPGTGGDLNGDGVVDVLDFAEFVQDFGCGSG